MQFTRYCQLLALGAAFLVTNAACSGGGGSSAADLTTGDNAVQDQAAQETLPADQVEPVDQSGEMLADLQEISDALHPDTVDAVDAVDDHNPVDATDTDASPDDLLPDLSEPVTVTVGPAGGSVALDDGSVRLWLPPGALPQEVDVTLAPLESKTESETGPMLPVSIVLSPPVQLLAPALLSFPKTAFADGFKIARLTDLSDALPAGEPPLELWWPLATTRPDATGATAVALPGFSDYAMVKEPALCLPAQEDLTVPPAPEGTRYVATYTSINSVLSTAHSVIPPGHFPTPDDVVIVHSRDFVAGGTMQCSLVVAHFFSPDDSEAECKVDQGLLATPELPAEGYKYLGYDVMVNLQLIETTIPLNYKEKESHISIIHSESSVVDGVLKCDIVVRHLFVPVEEGTSYQVAFADGDTITIISVELPSTTVEGASATFETVKTLKLLDIGENISGSNWRYDYMRDKLYAVWGIENGLYAVARVDDLSMAYGEVPSPVVQVLHKIMDDPQGLYSQTPKTIGETIHLDVQGDRLVVREHRSWGGSQSGARSNRVLASASMGATDGDWIYHSEFKNGLCGPPWNTHSDFQTNIGVTAGSDPGSSGEYELLAVPKGDGFRFISLTLVADHLAAFDYTPSTPGETMLNANIAISNFELGGSVKMVHSDMTGALYIASSSSSGVNTLARIADINGLESQYTDPFCPEDPEIMPSPGYYSDVDVVATLTDLPEGFIVGVDALGHTEEVVMVHYYGSMNTKLVFMRGGKSYTLEVPLPSTGVIFVEPSY